jgi:hypothetical protein
VTPTRGGRESGADRTVPVERVVRHPGRTLYRLPEPDRSRARTRAGRMWNRTGRLVPAVIQPADGTARERPTSAGGIERFTAVAGPLVWSFKATRAWSPPSEPLPDAGSQAGLAGTAIGTARSCQGGDRARSSRQVGVSGHRRAPASDAPRNPRSSHAAAGRHGRSGRWRPSSPQTWCHHSSAGGPAAALRNCETSVSSCSSLSAAGPEKGWDCPPRSGQPSGRYMTDQTTGSSAGRLLWAGAAVLLLLVLLGSVALPFLGRKVGGGRRQARAESLSGSFIEEELARPACARHHRCRLSPPDGPGPGGEPSYRFTTVGIWRLDGR